MDERSRVNREDLLLAEQAAEWLQRMENPTAQDRAAFVKWLRESPKHLREVLLAATWDEALSEMDPDRRIDVQELASTASKNVVPVQGNLSQIAHKLHGEPSWPRKAGLGLAAAAAIAAVAVWSLLQLQPREYETAIGEQRSVELRDGSVVSLNTESAVRIDLSDEARDVYLNEGQALFVVAHDKSRPFRVHVGNAIVQALGTKFDVRLAKDGTAVSVLEGQVRIDSAAAGASNEQGTVEMHERARVVAGEGVNISANGEVTEPAPINIDKISAWQQRRVILAGSTLVEIVDEFNRYNRKPRMRIEGETVAEGSYEGSLEADDPESFIQYLRSKPEFGIEVERESGGFILRAKPADDASAQPR